MAINERTNDQTNSESIPPWIWWSSIRCFLTQNQCHLTTQTVVNMQWILFIVLLLISNIRAHNTAWYNLWHFCTTISSRESQINWILYRCLFFSFRIFRFRFKLNDMFIRFGFVVIFLQYTHTHHTHTFDSCHAKCYFRWQCDRWRRSSLIGSLPTTISESNFQRQKKRRRKSTTTHNWNI